MLFHESRISANKAVVTLVNTKSLEKPEKLYRGTSTHLHYAKEIITGERNALVHP